MCVTEVIGKKDWRGRVPMSQSNEWPSGSILHQLKFPNTSKGQPYAECVAVISFK